MKYIKSIITEIKDRFSYAFEMWKWERVKRNEGFPKEWFEDE